MKDKDNKPADRNQTPVPLYILNVKQGHFCGNCEDKMWICFVLFNENEKGFK